MALARGCWRSHESRSQPPWHARSPLARPGSAPTGNGDALAAVFRLFETGSLRPMNVIYRTVGQSAEGCRLPSSAPTSAPCGNPCSRFVSGTSSATLLLLMAVFSVLHRPVESAAQEQTLTDIETGRGTTSGSWSDSARTAYQASTETQWHSSFIVRHAAMRIRQCSVAVGRGHSGARLPIMAPCLAFRFSPMKRWTLPNRSS
jgi:hypothetical protein